MQGALQGEKGSSAGCVECRVRGVQGAYHAGCGRDRKPLLGRDMQLHCRLDNITADDMRPTSFDSESSTAWVA